MEHIRIKSIKRDAYDYGIKENCYNNNSSQSKLNVENMEASKEPTSYFGPDGYSGDKNYGK